jgi:PAS domain-containing protein
MLLLVFDDYKLHMRRLGVVNSLTSSITRAQQHGPIMATALEELKGLMHAKSAWFRLVEGDRMVIAQQIGLSKGFLQDRLSVPLDDDFERTLGGTVPVVLVTAAAPETVRPYLKQEGFHHVVMVPVLGKKSVIGTLALGGAHRLRYSPDEMEFLVTTAHQLGLAVENLRLVEQILRSHRQWTNTFDSIHDLVLLHDSDFRVMKANHALLERLNLAPADVVGQLCEAVLPHNRGQWKGCPYCGHPKRVFTKAPIPALAASPWSQPLLTWSREASRKAPFTWCATPPTGASPKKNTAYCLSRCRKAFSWPLPKANCSIAMTLSFACSATAAARMCWP